MNIRAYLFEFLKGREFVAELQAAEQGIVAGTELLRKRSAELGFQTELLVEDGVAVSQGSIILRVSGSAEEIARAEEELLACVGKTSGVATASADFVAQAGGKARVVCGAWKKIAPPLRSPLRQAIAVGGAGIRLVDEPFVYLDKNYVRMFGSISAAVERAHGIDGHTVCVQLRGQMNRIEEEAVQAFDAGAGVLMVDTGNMRDLETVVSTANRKGFRNRARVAFSGGVTAFSLSDAISLGADIIDVGRSIIDAPLLDFRLDVVRRI